MKKYVASPRGLGVPPANILDAFDSELPPTDLDLQIVSFLTERRPSATDVIFYYVGHGGFTRASHDYYLALRTTRKRAEGISSLRVSDLAATLNEHAGQLRRHLVLDACFAASAYKEFQSAPLNAAVEKTLDAFPAVGTTLLCASGARDPALAPQGHTYTMFTGALLSVLESGVPHGPARLSVREIGHQVKNRIFATFPDERARPEVHSPEQSAGDIALVPLFPNAAYRDAPAAHSPGSPPQPSRSAGTTDGLRRVSIRAACETATTMRDLIAVGLRLMSAATRSGYNQILLSATAPNSQLLVVVGDAIAGRRRRYRYADLTGFIGEAVLSGAAAVADDVRGLPAYIHAVRDTLSEIVVPIRMGATVVGALNSESPKLAHYGPAIREELQDLAIALGDGLHRVGYSPRGNEGDLPWVQGHVAPL